MSQTGVGTGTPLFLNVMRLMYFRLEKSSAEAIDKRWPEACYRPSLYFPDELFVEDAEPH